MMATPDPYINELRLISYQPKPRTCKNVYKVPRRNDFIEVLWCLDHLPGLPNRWCAAEVLHISGHHAQDYLATGVILYTPGETWEEQVDKVEFLDDQMLRCAANDDKEESELCSDDGKTTNPNPTLRWRFRGDHSEDSRSEQEDQDWAANHNRDVSVSQRNALIRLRHEKQGSSQQEVELKSLRDGYASMFVEMEKVKRELLKVSQHLATLQRQDIQPAVCTSAGCVLPRLRQKLALKMQAGLRQAPAALKKRKLEETEQSEQLLHVGGFHPGVMKARVECTLHQFENFARQVREGCAKASVFFFPEFSYTQLPLQNSLEFRVLFKTFSLLCDMIGVRSSADKKEMARKCGKGAHGELLRMLGTYAYDDEDDECSTAQFYPGTSCGDLPSQSSEEGQALAGITENADNAKPDQLFPVLTRRTREWDRVDCRYRHGLRKDYIALPTLREECSELQAFAIVWKRAAEVGGKAWSQAMCDSGEVFGWLDICLPFVQTQGKSLCQELGGLASDDVWDDLLRGYPSEGTS